MLSERTLWQDLKTSIASWLRARELRWVGDDADKIRQITDATEDETLRKWLWTISIAGAPVCFIAVPIVLVILGILFSSFIMQILWYFAKLAMLLELGLFGLAIWFTMYFNRRS